MSMIIRLVLLTLGLIMLTSARQHPDSTIKNTSFSVSGGIHYSFKELARSINGTFPDLLYKDDSFDNNDNDGIISYVYKSKPIYVFKRKSALISRVPMRLKIKYRARYPIDISFFFFNKTFIIDQEQEFVFDISVDFRTKVALDQSLEGKSYTDYEVDWITYPYVEFYGFVKFRVTKLVRKILDKILLKYSQGIDKEVMDNLKVRQYLADVSESFKAPFLLDRDTGLWGKFIFYPRLDVSQVFFSEEHQACVLNFTSSGRLRFAMDKKEERVRRIFGSDKKVEFSSEIRDIESDNFSLDSVISISFDQLQNFVFLQMGKGQFIVGEGRNAMRISELYFDVEKSVKDDSYNLVADVYLYPIENPSVGNSMRLKISFVPLLDKKKGLLQMQDVDFKLISENKFLFFASVVAKAEFRQRLTEKVSLSMEEYLANIQEHLNKSLYQREITKKLNVKATIWSTKIKNILLSKEHIDVSFSLQGKMTFYLKNLF